MQISDNLRDLAKTYLAMCDEPDEHIGTPERDAERTAAHEAMMDAMQAENIPFNARYEARWMARWLLSGNEIDFKFQPDVFWVNPTTTPQMIRYFPPEDNRQGWVPCILTLLPITNQNPTFDRNLT